MAIFSRRPTWVGFFVADLVIKLLLATAADFLMRLFPLTLLHHRTGADGLVGLRGVADDFIVANHFRRRLRQECGKNGKCVRTQRQSKLSAFPTPFLFTQRPQTRPDG